MMPLASLASLIVSALAGDLTLLAPESPGKCMDGTAGGFYLEKATRASDSNKWILWLEGGGECTTQAYCALTSLTNLGSSSKFQKTTTLYHLASADADENPVAASWNRVLLKYCSQDLWSGTRTETSADTWNFLFSGHLVFEEVLRRLEADHGFANATDVVLGGDSAGGIGAWLNVGWLRDFVPQARVVAAPLAGFYGFAQPYAGPGARPGGLSDFREEAWPHHVALWRSRVDPDCAAAMGARSWACMLSNYSRPHIRAPAFVTEAQTDQVQLEEHDAIPGQPFSQEETAYVIEWKQNMSYALRQLPASDGFFNPACYTHTGFSKAAPLISNTSGTLLSYGHAFAQWYGGAATRLEDSCGILCGHCGTDVIV